MTAEELIKDKKIKFIDGDLVLPEGNWYLEGRVLRLSTVDENLYCVSINKKNWCFRYRSENGDFFNNGEKSGTTSKWQHFYKVKDVDLIFNDVVLKYHQIEILNHADIKIILQNNNTLYLSYKDLNIKLK